MGDLIKRSFDEGRHTYGRKRIQDDLKDWREKVSKRRIGKSMEKLGLWCKTRKLSRPLQTQSTMSKYHLTVMIETRHSFQWWLI
ncbi:MAG: transposase [Methylococcaceae bacterium]|nr:transposase [Methylococcaceae bacterium]